jgi:hypothetical protein
MSKEVKAVKPNKTKEQLKQVTEAVKAIPNVWTNLQHLVEALCLVAVAGYSFWASYQFTFAIEYGAYALRFAAVVIAVRGGVEFLKQLNKR